MNKNSLDFRGLWLLSILVAASPCTANAQTFIMPVPRLEPLTVTDIRRALNSDTLEIHCGGRDWSAAKACTYDDRPNSTSIILKNDSTFMKWPNGSRRIVTLRDTLTKAGQKDTLAYLSDIGSEMRMYVGVTGDLKGALNDGNTSSSVATGALQLTVDDGWSRTNTWGHTVVGQVSIAAVDDTVATNHASSLLAPRTGRLSTQLTALLYRRIRWNYSAYAKFYGYVSTVTWSKSVTTDSTTSVFTRDGNVNGLGLLLGLQVFKIQNARELRKGGAIAVEVGLAFRRVGGALIDDDPATGGGTGEEVEREHFTQSMFDFPDNGNGFWAAEAGVVASFNGFTFGVTFYNFFKENILGLSGGQLAGGISISVDLISI